jgi:hypothetical protein
VQVSEWRFQIGFQIHGRRGFNSSANLNPPSEV